jgi:hypothetical protein
LRCGAEDAWKKLARWNEKVTNILEIVGEERLLIDSTGKIRWKMVGNNFNN